MTLRTRSSNKNADFKVYYSKKIPQQAYFPHKRKTVRRRSTPEDGGKRQMVFLPEKMRIKSATTIEDSDEEADGLSMEEDMEAGGVLIEAEADCEKEEQCAAQMAKRKAKKRSSDVMQTDESDDDEPIRPTPKRRRNADSPKQVEAESGDGQDTANKVDRARTIRRQSTMTQLVDGRRPLPGVEEPEFRPVKRSPRLSWSGKGKSDKTAKYRKQQTLTQMVPRVRSADVSDEDMQESLSDFETEEKVSQEYGDAIARRLAQQGLHRAERNGDEKSISARKYEKGIQPVMDRRDDDELPAHPQDDPALVVQSVEDFMHQDCEDDYQPTLYIDASVTRTDRTTRPKSAAQRAAEAVTGRSGGASKSRFGLLSTPEKQRIREIASSQSPADSPLSTQLSSQKRNRSPLKERTRNLVNTPETPSSRKQVAFEVPSKEPIPPPTLRKFQSTILDSEDDDDDVIEEDVPSSGLRIAVGADTQAMLDQIDQACTHADGDESSSQGSTVLPQLRGNNEPSPELGEFHTQSKSLRRRTVSKEHSSQTAHTGGTEDPPLEDDGDATLLPVASSPSPHKERLNTSNATSSTEVELSTPAKELHSTPPINEAYLQDPSPSTPMVIQDNSSDEEDVPGPTPSPTRRRTPQQPLSTGIQQSTDLDGEPIQVPRSPSPHHETQQSHSSKAEQLLQSSWLSYSQYVGARPPQSASMHVDHDAFSYNATPRPPHHSVQSRLQPSGYHPSQATTVDEVTQRTPRKNRTQHLSSTHTTPHRVASSQPVISPSKPPPLFIPSSFPSPAKAVMEGWSSPLLGQTQRGYRSSQWASLEDFSIPPPPP
ncbi:hypothetical protein EJ02DRAFT_317592, partial [Clathrospora elynae]